VVIYTGAPLNLERALDATQAHSLADANIIHRSPNDRSVFTLDTEVDVEGTRLPIAEPVSWCGNSRPWEETTGWRQRGSCANGY
jgi:hypothetical protein